MDYKVRNKDHLYLNFDFIKFPDCPKSVHMDIDRCIERNGNFLMMEFKTDHVDINNYIGQKTTLNMLQKKGITVIVVYHKVPNEDRTFEVTGWSPAPFTARLPLDNKGLKDMIGRWLENC